MENATRLSRRTAYRVPVMMMIIAGVALFLPAGSLQYWEAWLYWLGLSLVTILMTGYFLKKSPELLLRRMQFGEKTHRKTPAWYSLFWIGFIIPGLDHRFHWSSVPVWLVIAANVAVLAGYLIIFLVFQANHYASTIIQVETEQAISATGPYAVIRHPMYSGLLLIFFATPFALGSYWAILPFLPTIPMNVSRIHIEEEVLLRELPGYRDYCLKTRYRLLPSIW